MSAVDSMFEELRRQGRKALIPFLTAGDPDLEFTTQALAELARRGASVLEVGVPYSDPIADGPVIQASYTRALARHIRVPQILEALRGLAPTIRAPLVTMISYAIVYRRGLEAFVAEAKASGVAGLIIPDLLVDEAERMAAICRRQDVSLIQLVTPTTPRDRAVRIAESSSGFLYYVSVTGITGERRELPPDLLESVSWLKARTTLPICIGFGISTPEHVRQVAPVADGVIVGSALVRRIAAGGDRPRAELLRDLGDYASELLAALG